MQKRIANADLVCCLPCDSGTALERENQLLIHQQTYSRARLLNALSIHPPKQALIFSSILIGMQLVDALFTYMGVSRYGIYMEGNPLLRLLMQEFGVIMVLGSVKLTAIFSILLILYSSICVRWAPHALFAISAVYGFAALLPWSYILFL